MNVTPTRPFVASDATVATAVERWLDRQGYLIAYGPNSARAERGDLTIGVGNGAVPAPTISQLEAA